MAKGWRKPPECRQPAFGRAVRELRARTGLKQQDLAQRVGISPSALSHFERDGDRCFTGAQRKTLIEEVVAPLQRRGSADVTMTCRELLQLAFLTPTIYFQGNREAEREAGWEREWRNAMAAREVGNHELAKRLFTLVEHLKADDRSLAALAIAHQAQEALDLQEQPSRTSALITAGLHRLGGRALPSPELSPSPDKLEALLPDDLSRRAYAQLAKVSVRRFQDLQAFSQAQAALRARANTAKIIEDEIEAARTRVGCIHDEALLLTLAHTVPTDLDERPWSWVRDPVKFHLAADLFEEAYHARGNDEVGRAFDLRGMVKTLHMLETCSSLGTREKRRIAADRADIELELAGWVAKHPAFEGVHALLHLAAARRARERRHDGTAVDELEATIDLAWRIHSPYLLADALGRRGEILAVRPGDRRLAVDQLAAAFAGWPTRMFSDDRDRLKRWLRRLGVSVEEVAKAWASENSPSAPLRALPGFDETQAAIELRRALAGI